MDPELILKQSLAINIRYQREKDDTQFNLEEFKTAMKLEHAAFVENYSAIFNISLSPSYNFNRLKKMLILAKKVKTNELTEHAASVQVGQILVDEVVKPQLNKD